MKLKSLILGSVAAAGLSTAGYAADLGVLTSLDVCDSLGISGLTISSSTNCLKISGNVTYEFNWGDYAGNVWQVNANDAALNVMDNNGVAPLTQDWSSDVDMWLKFVGSAASDFGTASATIKLDVSGDPQITVVNEAITAGAAGGDPIVLVDEAFVSVGDSTTIMAGKKGSIANDGNDVPLNFLGLFNSEAVDTGVDTTAAFKPTTGGHVIQVVSTVADGLVLKGGLEALNAAPTEAGTLVGVVEYAGNGIKAHITGMAGGILDGHVEEWAAHAGFEGAFDNFSVVGAGAFGATDGGNNYWNVLGSAKATFDMFEIALSGEATGGTTVNEQYGLGGSIGAKVTDDVKLNLGARWFDEDTATANTETIHIAAQIVAAVAQGVTLTGEVGYYGTNEPVVTQTDLYGLAKLEWKPGGEKNFTSAITGQVHSTGAYKVTFKASKDFE